MAQSTLSDRIRECTNEAALFALTDLIGNYKRRIQQEGKATDEGQIGRYSAKYAAYRKESGRQTAKVDLTFTGDMINSIQLGEFDGKLVMGFEEREQREKADQNESIFSKKIFSLTDNEIKRVAKNFGEKLQECLNKL